MHRVVTLLGGGLGNQLFMYFAGLARAQAQGVDAEVRFTSPPVEGASLIDFRLSCHVTVENRPQALWRRLGDSRVRGLVPQLARYRFYSQEVGFDPELTKQPIQVLAQGYFQTWRYFDSLPRPIRALELKAKSTFHARVMDELTSESPIVLHVRRGDYLNPQNKAGYGCLNDQYFVDAIGKLRSTDSESKVWLFTEDSQEVVQLAATLNARVFDAALSASETMHLMSRANKFVISNSSFSYWAALLSESSAVVAPGQWFRSNSGFDPCPPSWKRVESKWID